ncbi:hypothetical protein KAR91_31410 [Candidatus Pacearchaeota archaeon]|nr:hypothetical protein [Candidatus Pacearchaeota archaeon]
MNIEKLNKVIKQTKTKILNKTLKIGIKENFGQNEVESLKNKYGQCLELTLFSDWCSLVDLDYLRTYEKIKNKGGIINFK